MHIESGTLVKTLNGTIVKVEKLLQPGYWYCDDGRIHLAAGLREPSQEECALYVAPQHSVDAKPAAGD